MGIFDYLEQRNRERVFRARVEDSKKIGFGLVLGTAIGAGIGLLTAPKSGEETRKDIANAARDAGAKVRDKADEYVNVARGFGSEMESRLNSIAPAIGSGLEAAGSAYQENKESRLIELGRMDGKEVADKAKDVAKEVKKGAENVAEDVKDGAKEVKDDVKDAANEVKKDVKDAADKVNKKN